MMNVAAVIFDPSERHREDDGQCHHPAGVGRGVSDRGKEVTMLGTGGGFRHLTAMVGGEFARDDSR